MPINVVPEPKKQLVTSLRINPEIWKDAKVEAIRHDMTLTQLVEEALKLWMEKDEEKKKK